MDFELTLGQKQTMDMAERLMADKFPCIPAVLTGFAGTGKTTMIKAIASRFGNPVVLAPTGKATVRVKEATGLEALTIHRWLYQTMEDQKTGELQFRKKDPGSVSRPENGLLVIDEASMIGRDIWEDIWDMCQRIDLKVLLVGDPFQLPPVEPSKTEDEESFSALTNIKTEYRSHLSEVTRQALDNPILRASMMIRESSQIDKALPLLNRVFRRQFDDKCMEVFKDGGAIIVHRNATRHNINKVLRERLGYKEDLVEGEPLLVLRNTYEIDRFNGEVIQFQGWGQYDSTQIAVADRWRNVSMMLGFGLAKVDGQEVMLSPEQVRGEAQHMTESVIAKASRRLYVDAYAPEGFQAYGENGAYLGPPHLHANFGYALTCHKSQGSEWKSVLVLIETSTRPTSIEGRRWLYTAITRAKEKCYISTEV
jgi:exodeoxyribonuclease-5